MIDIDTNSSTPQIPQLIVTVWQAGEIIGVPRGTVKKWLDEGRFPIKTHKAGRNRMCVVADILAYAASKSSNPTPAPSDQKARPAPRGPGRPRRG